MSDRDYLSIINEFMDYWPNAIECYPAPTTQADAKTLINKRYAYDRIFREFIKERTEIHVGLMTKFLRGENIDDEDYKPKMNKTMKRHIKRQAKAKAARAAVEAKPLKKLEPLKPLKKLKPLKPLKPLNA